VCGVGCGALVGLVAAAVGLAVAELVAGTRRAWRSPVLDVGDRVVDNVPRPVKDVAIEWFGTNDKVALLAGIAGLLAIYAVAIGVLAVRVRLRWGLVGVAGFGLIGAVSASAARADPPLTVTTPSIVGAVAAGLAMTALGRATSPSRSDPSRSDPSRSDPSRSDPSRSEPADASVVDPSRRRLLVMSAAFVGTAGVAWAAGRRLQDRTSAAVSRAARSLPRPRRALAAVPASVQVDGATPFITPNADFYRIDINLSVPSIDVETWRLRVHGLVEREVELSFDDLVARGLVESDITLTCVSNEVGGRLVGTARWTGVRLDDLLAEAGVSADADQVVGRSVDDYTCGFTLGALDGRDALVAIGMNGELLPLEHGYPARLVVPGLYGYVSATKWLTEIELTRFDAFDQYWVRRGWEPEAPIKTSSRIDTPRGLAKVPAGTVAVAGVAWAQTRGIEAVEVRVDDGPWRPASLATELNDVTWRQWSYAWDATPGRHEITVRATDANGDVQTDERREPFPDGATGQHTIVVIVEG
jgi:DMSO/TMAO reductase YedYZ molybdopterin-dependent catalytic subunit